MTSKLAFVTSKAAFATPKPAFVTSKAAFATPKPAFVKEFQQIYSHFSCLLSSLQ
ncbi:hypothetical protein [Nostoc sp.]|uniref:hypothetical protein n=1 Tax=Nostoc sp. TaxID=1180 RepID=UPI002FF7A659